VSGRPINRAAPFPTSKPLRALSTFATNPAAVCVLPAADGAPETLPCIPYLCAVPRPVRPQLIEGQRGLMVAQRRQNSGLVRAGTAATKFCDRAFKPRDILKFGSRSAELKGIYPPIEAQLRDFLNASDHLPQPYTLPQLNASRSRCEVSQQPSRGYASPAQRRLVSCKRSRARVVSCSLLSNIKAFQ